MYHYYVGLDLGQSSDYTAISILEEPVWIGAETDWTEFGVFIPDSVGEDAGWVSPARLSPQSANNALAVNYKYGRVAHPPLYLRHLERFELGTKYSKVVERVKQILLREPIRRRLKRARLLVDKTGVGAAVVDGFWQAGVRPISVTIHGGSNINVEPHGYRVPMRNLVAAAQVLLQSGRLKIAEGLPEAQTLKKELLNFRQKIDPRTAHDSYEHWREGDHDDLVLATALAAWYREHINAAAETRNVRQGGFSVKGERTEPGEYARIPRR
jgi:hypothetical protein